jgi:hypothetical protein
LKSSDLKSPPWGVWGCKRTYSTAPKEGGEFMRIEKKKGNMSSPEKEVTYKNKNEITNKMFERPDNNSFYRTDLSWSK